MAPNRAPELARSQATPRGCRRALWLVFPFIFGSFLNPASGAAQETRKRKVPVVDKITSGQAQQAFSGKVQSLDLERKLLNVSTVQGGGTEVFPIRKGIRVAKVGGEKLNLDDLIPGTNVIVYFEQKGERRTVKQIVVLAAAPAETKKTPPPS